MEGNDQFEKLHELQTMLKERLTAIKNAESGTVDFSNAPAMLHPENLV